MTRLSHALFATTLSLALAAVFVDAQETPKPASKPHADHGGMHHGMMKMGAKDADPQCPMAAAAEIADVRVEKSKLGATIVLTAKDPKDAAKVQELAREFAVHLAAHSAHAR